MIQGLLEKLNYLYRNILTYFLPSLTLFLFSCKEEQHKFYSEINEEVFRIEEPNEGITGEPIPYSLHLASKDSLVEPQETPAIMPITETANKNVVIATSPDITLIPDTLEGIPLNLFQHQDSIIEPIPKLTGHQFPKFQFALEPNYKDNAYYNIQYLDVDQGLGTSYILDVIEDHMGNLWMATWANGAVKYDGYRFYYFDVNWGLSSDYVWSVLQDSQGNIWFGTDGSGLNRYDGNKVSQYDTDDGLAGDLIFKIFEDSKGTLWFATDNGLSYYDGQYFYSIKKSDGLPSNKITTVFEDSQNRLWVGTEGGACYIKDNELYLIGENEGLPSKHITIISEDNQENLWFGTYDNGVIQFDGYSFFHFKKEQGFIDNSVNDILTDRYGNVWFATEGGVCMFNRMEFSHYSTHHGISHNSVRTLLQDSDGNIWFGTYGGGINKINENSFENYSENRGLMSPIVRDIVQDQEDNLWLAHSDGITRYDNRKMTHYTVESGLSSSIARCLQVDSEGNLWIGMNSSGATVFDGTVFKHYNTSSGLSGNMILDIHEDMKGRLWFGTYGGGLTIKDGEEFYYLTQEDGLGSNTIRVIEEDNQGNIWLGTLGGGAVKVTDSTITRYTVREGLHSDYVISFLPRSDESIWIGTEGTGISILNSNGSVHHLTKKSGLSNNIIWSMIEDPNGSIWISTEEGLNQYQSAENEEFRINTFGKLDGLKGLDFYPNAVCLDSENRLWWGSGKSLVMLNLNKYENNPEPPVVSISTLEIEQVFIDFRKLEDSLKTNQEIYLNEHISEPLNDIKFSSIRSFTNVPEELTLPYSFNNLTIHFSGIDWSAPHKLRYQYKLEGYDDNWSPLRLEKKATLGNLSSGTYTFKVRAIGEAQIYSQEASLKITILSPWYLTWYAIILYIITGLFTIYILFKWRTQALTIKKNMLEKVVKQRTAEYIQQKDIVEKKNKEITSSINYAKRIQNAILPSEAIIHKKLPDSFIYYLPKDIVAGDFYWLEEVSGKILVAAADCTGHGVPGAMVSVVCNNALNRTVREFNLSEPNAILNKVRDIVIDSFSQGEEEIMDGMDIALLSIDAQTKTVQYSGANNNLYLIRNGELQIFVADKQPIGKYKITKDFTKHQIPIEKGDTLYIFTDGYADQFGGPRRKKFKYKSFSQLLIDIHLLPMSEQREILNKEFHNWKGDLDQIDDVCVIGLRL